MTWLDEHSAYFENSMGSLKQVGREHFSSNKMMVNFKQVFYTRSFMSDCFDYVAGVWQH